MRLICAAAVFTMGVMIWTPSALGAQQVISSSGPLTGIYLNDNLQCNATHTGDTAPEFYSSTASGSCGTFISVGGSTYGFIGSPYGLVSQTPVTGSGTSTDPYRVVTVVDVGATGLRITQTDSYIVGQEAYRTDITVSNSTDASIDAAVYHAADCYLQDSDFGYGFYDSATNSIFCSKTANNSPPDRIEGFIPLHAGASYYEASYDTVYAAVNGSQFPNTCDCTVLQDNGAGLSWAITVPAHGSVTRSLLTSFSPAGRVPLSVSKTADSASVTAGSIDGYTITVSNPNSGAVTLDSVTDALPAGFSYVAGSTTGATTANPSVSGQSLTWSGPIAVPGGTADAPGTASLHFQVHVSSTPGDYSNDAGGSSTDFIVIPTGPTATVHVSPRPTFALSLSPTNGTNTVGTSHTVTAHLTDNGSGVSGQTIRFTVSGANTDSGSGTTDGSGNASFSYTGTNAGPDTITACNDANGNATCDADEATATATKAWTTGGGGTGTPGKGCGDKNHVHERFNECATKPGKPVGGNR